MHFLNDQMESAITMIAHLRMAFHAKGLFEININTCLKVNYRKVCSAHKNVTVIQFQFPIAICCYGDVCHSIRAVCQSCLKPNQMDEFNYLISI